MRVYQRLINDRTGSTHRCTVRTPAKVNTGIWGTNWDASTYGTRTSFLPVLVVVSLLLQNPPAPAVYTLPKLSLPWRSAPSYAAKHLTTVRKREWCEGDANSSSFKGKHDDILTRQEYCAFVAPHVIITNPLPLPPVCHCANRFEQRSSYLTESTHKGDIRVQFGYQNR